MAKFNGYINGFYNDLSADGDLFQQERILVIWSDDAIGKTLSLGSEKHHVQITIPFDKILEMINEGRK